MKPEKVDKTGRRRPQLKKEPLSVGSIADAGSIAGDVSSIDDLSDLGVELQSREISSFQDDTDSSATVGSPPAEPLGFPKMEEEDNDMEDILIDESNRVQQGYLSETGVFESSFFASLNGLEPPAVSSASSSVIVHPAGCSDTLAANNGSSRQDTSVAPWERLQVYLYMQYLWRVQDFPFLLKKPREGKEPCAEEEEDAHLPRFPPF